MSIKSSTLSIRTIGCMYGVDGKKLSFWYKYFLSGYEEWEQRYHASEYVLFKENIGERRLRLNRKVEEESQYIYFYGALATIM